MLQSFCVYNHELNEYKALVRGVEERFAILYFYDKIFVIYKDTLFMCIQWSFVQVLSLHLDITYRES